MLFAHRTSISWVRMESLDQMARLEVSSVLKQDAEAKGFVVGIAIPQELN